MLTAKTVVKNKYWIVEQDGDKIATIQASPTGVTYVCKNYREQFASINVLKAKYSISFDKPKKSKDKHVSTEKFHVNGIPCDQYPYNSLLNLAKKLPVYTKTEKSKSFFCAGYYLIKINNGIMNMFCPKLITLSRYPYYGPFNTAHAAKEYAKTLKETHA